MNSTEALQALQTAGTEQNRKIYRRHGVGDNLFGVSYADLGKLRKRIKTDHALARDLWASGVHDARILATMIADAAQLTADLLDAWVKDLDNAVLADALAGLAAQSPSARARHDQWVKAKSEWVARAGWTVLAHLVRNDPQLDDAFFLARLERIERDIHRSKNRVRDAMNMALIAVGLRNDALKAKALAAAGRIGKVEVDHGETDCKTPAAAAYIEKASSRKARGRAGC
jgi:3-methyladenine DNA glycosylase AlkD